MEYNLAPNTDPCGTPHSNAREEESASVIRTYMKLFILLIIVICIFVYCYSTVLYFAPQFYSEKGRFENKPCIFLFISNCFQITFSHRQKCIRLTCMLLTVSYYI